jgi:trimethylamine:corrinoid methyltransferase-like protein
MLDNYQEPRLDEGKLEALEEFIARREKEIPAAVS